MFSTHENYLLKNWLARYKENEVMLNEEQHTEMCSIVERTENDDLEKLFKEGNEHGIGELMKEIWFTDKNIKLSSLLMIRQLMVRCVVAY